MTRGLAAFTEASLPSATLVPDVTTQGASAQSLFAGLETGAFTVGYMASGYLSGRVPSLGVLDVPFSVSDRSVAHARLDGPAGDRLRSDVEAATDLVVLAFWDNGFRHLTNRMRALQTPDDCRGLTVRTLNNALYQDTMRAIGFEPVVTDVKELVAACESGRVDAQENPLTNMLGFGLDRWHRHVSLTGHIFGVILLVAHKPWFAALPAQMRDRVMQAARTAAESQRQAAAAEDAEGRAVLLDRGVTIQAADAVDLAAFRAATNTVRANALATLPDSLCQHYLG